MSKVALIILNWGRDTYFNEVLNKNLSNTGMNEDVLENFHFENGNIPAPLWQQAFDWFRVKYFIISSISFFEWADRYYYKLDMPFTISPNFVTYKEARLECLKKLIEIVKEQK